MKHSKNIWFFLFVFWTFATNAANNSTAVKYGGDENIDACSTLAVVANLGDGVDEFLAVKTAPSLKATRFDKLLKGQSVWICDEKKDWYGIVYTQDEKQDCGVTSPIEKRKVYEGPCKSGWVNKKYVKPIGG